MHGSQLALFGDATAPEQVRAVVDREVEMHIEDCLRNRREVSDSYRD